MSEELLKQCGLEKGQKVLWLVNFGGSPHLRVVTVKDVCKDYQDFLVLLTEESDGCISLPDIYSLRQIQGLLEGNEIGDEGGD